MASLVDTQKFLSNHKIDPFDFDPDATGPTHVGFVDLSGYEGIVVKIQRKVGTGDLSEFSLDLNPDSAGLGTDVEAKVHPLTSQPDAVGDMLLLELTTNEVHALGDDLRYVTATIDQDTAGDEFCVTYIRYGYKFPQKDLSADVIA